MEVRGNWEGGRGREVERAEGGIAGRFMNREERRKKKKHV